MKNGLVLKKYYLIDLYMRKNIQVNKQAQLAISFANSKEGSLIIKGY